MSDRPTTLAVIRKADVGAYPRRPCVWCEVPLIFAPGPPRFEESAWRHENTLEIYAGECLCVGVTHRTLYRRDGRINCRTWRDDHCALAVAPGGVEL